MDAKRNQQETCNRCKASHNQQECRKIPNRECACLQGCNVHPEKDAGEVLRALSVQSDRINGIMATLAMKGV